ncbi:hypothetical protein KMZ15_01275 [Mycoavidus sp. HKI]|uniref:hypothetical protein n=1 Tax=Mycoavidus sp. HKI TaxID=2840467 RepID=UPI001CBF2696|nr:hypothetical protein [Mycoavidus sp. HKI]UAW65057.1 hypothetical protein KMZ15_01275 [Mycoavidus sp. HKI]
MVIRRLGIAYLKSAHDTGLFKLPSLAYSLIKSPIISSFPISKILSKIGHDNSEINGHDKSEMTGHAPEMDGHDALKYARR